MEKRYATKTQIKMALVSTFPRKMFATSEP